MGNSEFSGKSTTDPRYCLLFVDLFTSKVYIYSMKFRKYILNTKEILYREVEGQRKGQKTRLQADQEFKQKKIFDFNKKYTVDMFSATARGGKALQPNRSYEN